MPSHALTVSLDESFTNVLAATFTKDPAPVSFKSNLTLYANSTFSGRDDQLAAIDKAFENSEPLHQRVALWGLGGIGYDSALQVSSLYLRLSRKCQVFYAFRKSQIALEYARRQSGRCDVLWVRATDIESLNESCLSIIQLLEPKAISGDSQEDMPARVKTYLEKTNSQWLLILDGADDKEDIIGDFGAGSLRLRRWIPRSNHGRILITTRDSRVTGLSSPLTTEFALSK